MCQTRTPRAVGSAPPGRPWSLTPASFHSSHHFLALPRGHLPAATGRSRGAAHGAGPPSSRRKVPSCPSAQELCRGRDLRDVRNDGWTRGGLGPSGDGTGQRLLLTVTQRPARALGCSRSGIPRPPPPPPGVHLQTRGRHSSRGRVPGVGCCGVPASQQLWSRPHPRPPAVLSVSGTNHLRACGVSDFPPECLGLEASCHSHLPAPGGPATSSPHIRRPQPPTPLPSPQD